LTLLSTRTSYSPILYPKAQEFNEAQRSVFWLPNEIPMGKDIQDWKMNLTTNEQQVVGHILKGFVITETFVSDFYSSKVARWFKHPEIQRMSATFSAFEGIHAESYARLNENLGLLDFDAFLHEPTAKAKIDRLMNTKGNGKADIARQLAIFSAFTEGVNLFSSFAVLLSFSKRNLLMGVGKIIEFSIRDESLHSRAGCWLFNEFIKEYPEIWTDELKKEIYEAARLTIELEDNFIEKAFEGGNIEGLDPKDLKMYIRYRANSKLQELGLKSNWKNIDKDALNRLQWFDVMSQGVNLQDFFAGRVSEYARSGADFDDIYED